MVLKSLVRGACVAALVMSLAACGGNSSTSATGSGGSGTGSGTGSGGSGSGGGTQQIQGIATPSSVAVVTAKNAG